MKDSQEKLDRLEKYLQLDVRQMRLCCSRFLSLRCPRTDLYRDVQVLLARLSQIEREEVRLKKAQRGEGDEIELN